MFSFYNIINYLINNNPWTMIVILTLVYWSLYKILKECLRSIFTLLKTYFLGINYKELEFEVLIKKSKEYNEIVINDEEIKPSEFLKLQNDAGDFAFNLYVFIFSVFIRASVLTLCTVVLFISIIFGIISFEEYKDFVRTYRIANGIWNDGKVPLLKTWRYGDGNQ